MKKQSQKLLQSLHSGSYKADIEDLSECHMFAEQLKSELYNFKNVFILEAN